MKGCLARSSGVRANRAERCLRSWKSCAKKRCSTFGEVSSAPRVNVGEMLYLVWDSVHWIVR
jgi:hypothetical protein